MKHQQAVVSTQSTWEKIFSYPKIKQIQYQTKQKKMLTNLVKQQLASAFKFSSVPVYKSLKDIPSTVQKKKLNLMNSLNEALDIALTTDKDSYIFGEDVKFGGVFRVTAGLNEKHGTDRVFNTPLCEQGIVAFAIGLATQNKRAIAEIEFADYIFPAFDQIVNEAAKFRYRSGSQFLCSGLVVRTPCGAVGHGGHYHSQSSEGYFAHTPGLIVVQPSNPISAKGLMLASIRSPNPVVFFEPKGLYRTAEDEVPVGDYEFELMKADVIKEGKDVTLIGYGPVIKTLKEAAKLAKEKENIDCEIVDLQTVYPFDVETVMKSVNKTGKCIVVHEAPVSSGIGAEVAAKIQEKCFFKLEAPIKRVCGFDTPFPLAHEPIYLPTAAKVLQAIREQMAN
eukprot:TRINITY_DN433_c0_g1_i7.p2 TRINITY_DN433_c0_g1~~TRINITY_DN433_c0_g1_i7.p2  ORF type:complete len:393 (+),score=75.25 TRINITY_DN433_c0_g1_i7:977-2155(+)